MKSDLPEKPSQLLVTKEQLDAAGVRVRHGATPADRYDDLLERFLSVPNRMVILYTSEDIAVESYIREHWNALDGLSGDCCDIYSSLLQLYGDEDAYTELGELREIPGVKTLNANDLPVAILWSNDAHFVASMKGMEHDALVSFFRCIFSDLRKIRRAINTEDVARLNKEIKAMAKKPTSEELSIFHSFAPILWAIPVILILPIMTYTLSSVGAFGSIIVFFFLLLLYGLGGSLALKAQGKLQEKSFVEVFKLVYSSSLAGMKELLSNLSERKPIDPNSG
jgi:hypothetical protein